MTFVIDYHNLLQYTQKMKNILVTGGAGFYGVNFILYFSKQNPDCHFTVLDSLEANGHLSEYNLGFLKEKLLKKIDFFRVDITQNEKVKRVFNKYFYIVVHFGAASTVLGVDNNNRAEEVNIEGTKIVFDAAINSGVETFLHQSTGLVYGKHQDAADESFPVNLQESAYAATKILGEQYIIDHSNKNNKTRVMITRPANTYGPFQWIDSRLIEGLCREVIKGEPIRLRSDGTELREFIYVEDAVMAIGNVLNYGKAGEIYNIGVDTMTSVGEISRLVAESAVELGYLQKTPEIISGVSRQNDNLSYLLDSSKIKKLGPGWKIKKSLKEGVRETLIWNFEHKELWNKKQ